MGLDERLIVPGGRVVPAQRHPHWLGPVAAGAERPAEARVGSIGHHHVASPDLADLAGGLVLDHGTDAGRQPSTVGGRHCRVQDRLEGLGPLPNSGPCLGGTLIDHGVEVVAGDDIPVRRKRRVLGPREIEHLAEGVGSQSRVAVRADQGALHAHVGDLAHRAGGQPVPTRLGPGELLLLHQGDVPARFGQPVGTRRAGRPAADDQDVVDVAFVARGASWVDPGTGVGVGTG